MTAKEQLRERIEELTEDEAAEALRLLDQRTDALTNPAARRCAAG